MNCAWKRFLCLILSLVLLLSLSACGSNSDNPQNITPDLRPEKTNIDNAPALNSTNYVWKGSFSPLSLDSDEMFQSTCFTEDGFYAAGQVKLGRREILEGEREEFEGQFDVYGTMLYFVDRSGNVRKLPNFTPSEPSANTGGNKDYYSYCSIEKLCLNEDGNIIALEMHEAGWYDGPEDIYGTDEMYEGDYIRDEQSYSIVVFSSDGTELSRAPVTVELSNSWFDSNSALGDHDGNLIVIQDGALLALAQDGTVAWSLLNDDDITSFVQLPDGTIAAMVSGNHGMELRLLDLERKSFGESFPIPDSAWSLITGDAYYDFYYSSGLYLYGFRLGEKESVQILNWMNCDVNSDSVDPSALHVYADGTISGICYDYSSAQPQVQLFTLTKHPAESATQKQVLTVAVLESTPNSRLDSLIIRFNRSHDNIRIEYVDYTQFNTEDDDSVGMTKFMTEIMAGNLPDIIPTSSLPYKQLAAKGLLENLYPYLDTDRELRREDFFPNLLAALEVNGGLYEVVSGFSVDTLTGAASIVGDRPGWTYDEFRAALAKMPEGCMPLGPEITRDDVLSALLYADMDSFIDWTTGRVSFESDSFKQLLEFVKLFPDEYIESDSSESTQDLIRQGKQMLVQTYLYGFDSILLNDVNFGGKSTNIGWPSSSGIGNIMRIEGGYGISATCSNKAAAWEFLRSMLTETGQADVYMIPSNRNVFDRQLKEYMTPIYRKDDNGNYLLDENGERVQEPRSGWVDGSGEEHLIYALTQEQTDEILNIIETCTKVVDYDSSIFDIVYAQSQAFFAGQKSIDDVAHLIQSKANIYINEQR